MGYCDDPFCRQQRGGRTHSCRGSSVVSCSGTGPSTAATPRTVQVCSDQHSESNGCKVTQHFSCREGWGGAQCYFSGTTYDGCFSLEELCVFPTLLSTRFAPVGHSDDSRGSSDSRTRRSLQVFG